MPKSVVRFCSVCGRVCRLRRKWLKDAIREFCGVRPSGMFCSEECKEKDSEARYQALQVEILKDCCKVCGIYACRNHDDWVVCRDCPSGAKYDGRVHWRCPYCRALPDVTLAVPGPREWSPRGLKGIKGD